jgi:hypothetical protein
MTAQRRASGLRPSFRQMAVRPNSRMSRRKRIFRFVTHPRRDFQRCAGPDVPAGVGLGARNGPEGQTEPRPRGSGLLRFNVLMTMRRGQRAFVVRQQTLRRSSRRALATAAWRNGIGNFGLPEKRDLHRTITPKPYTIGAANVNERLQLCTASMGCPVVLGLYSEGGPPNRTAARGMKTNHLRRGFRRDARAQGNSKRPALEPPDEIHLTIEACPSLSVLLRSSTHPTALDHPFVGRPALKRLNLRAPAHWPHSCPRLSHEATPQRV